MVHVNIDQLKGEVEAGPPGCWEALRKLGELAQPNTNAFIAGLFADPERTVRYEAVKALGINPANSDAAPLVATMLDDEDRYVRFWAGVTLNRLRGRPWTELELSDLFEAALAAHRNWWESEEDDEDGVALATLQDLGTATLASPTVDLPAADRVVEAGLELLKSSDPVERVFAIRVIREMHREHEVAQALLETLRDETDPDVISWCIGGLYFRGIPSAIPDLVGFLRHPDEDLRYRLAGALSSCTVPTMSDAARDALLELADDEDDDVRYSALFELSSWWQEGAVRDSNVRDRLEQGLTDPDEGVRRTCAEAFETAAS